MWAAFAGALMEIYDLASGMLTRVHVCPPQDKTGADPNRVGGPTNHLLSDGGLSTVIAGATNKTNSALTNSLQRLHTRSGGGADRSLSTAFRAIGAICDKLGLVRIIKDRACELYKKVSCLQRAATCRRHCLCRDCSPDGRTRPCTQTAVCHCSLQHRFAAGI